MIGARVYLQDGRDVWVDGATGLENRDEEPHDVIHNDFYGVDPDDYLASFDSAHVVGIVWLK